MANMGLDFGLERKSLCWKQKFRWEFSIPGISQSGVNSLPPSKAARPSMDFKEQEAQHLNETIYYPMKPEWKPVTLVLYDLAQIYHPIFGWIQEVYDPCLPGRNWVPPNEGFKKNGDLSMLSGCGDPIEIWRYENLWPQSVEFGDLDYGNSEHVLCEVTLRYDRAYIITQC